MIWTHVGCMSVKKINQKYCVVRSGTIKAADMMLDWQGFTFLQRGQRRINNRLDTTYYSGCCCGVNGDTVITQGLLLSEAYRVCRLQCLL